ncbi:hypothetical protein EI53_01526 [Fusobacterium naviforme]|nr:hypothetical protein EI53_01526 [Fusobacterium naviforme]STO26761.1 Uncharacterised protein [Fusobacterium naviforme]
MARKEKQPIHKVVMTDGKRQIIQRLLQEYDIESAEDIQDALKHPTVECKFPFNHAAFCLNSDIFQPFIFADFRRLAAKKRWLPPGTRFLL